MTRYYAIVMDGSSAIFASFANADQAEAYDMERMAGGYDSRTVGEIGGDSYLVVYRKPVKAAKPRRRGRDTTLAEKSPQKATGTAQEDPHRCRGCPECAVIFDSEGIHGHVPDRNSRTCQSCEHCRGADQ